MEESSASIRQRRMLELEQMLDRLLDLLHRFKLTPELDKSDILYSRRCRRDVQRIIHWMLVNETVDDALAAVSSNQDTSSLRKAIGYLAKSIRDSDNERARSEFRGFLFYPKTSHLNPDFVNREDVVMLNQAAFSSMGLCKRVDVASSSGMMNSEALNVLVGDRTVIPLIHPSRFTDKHVLVCCINVPAASNSRGMQSLFNLCHELSSLERGDIEIVMVARIHILCDAPELFKHVFKGLCSSCLVVPYEACTQRERIWKRLGFGTGEEFKCFSYDRAGMFLDTFCADGYVNPYGAEAFPFTTKMVEKVDVERKELRRGGSLEELLMPSYEDRYQDVVVYKFNKRDGPERHIFGLTVHRHVGLYVCCRGNLIPRLHEVYEQCKGRNVAFKIVVLYLPSLTNLAPETFRQKMDGLLQEQQIGGWWCLPFNNSVSLRFWGLTKDYYLGDYEFECQLMDKLIIVGVDGKILDMYGAEIISSHEIDATYHPFTRTAFVEKRMREIKSGGRLLRSLSEARLFRGTNPSDVISGNALSNKKVIIFMGEARVYESNGIKYDFGSMVSQYEEMKKDMGDEFEVVFVEFPIPRRSGAVDANEFSEIPWYVHCPLDGSYTDLSERFMDLVGEDEAMIGFGEDGLICSVRLLQKLRSYKTAGLCLEDTLLEDLHVFHGFDKYRDI